MMVDPESTPLSATQGRKRRLPSPGCLLVCTSLLTLAAVAVGFGVRIQRQVRLIRYFESLQAWVATEAAEPIWLHDSVNDLFGESIAIGFTEIEGLNFNGHQLGDAQLQPVTRLTHLRALSLTATSIGDDGLATVEHVPSLEFLWLDDTRVSDRGLVHLSRLPQLQTLILDNTQITDAGMPAIGQLPSLTFLSFTNTAVGDQGLASLRGLTSLESLYLDGTSD